MKKYVFITSRISNMGGAENYISSKKKWLEQSGWSVLVIHYSSGEVLLPWLKSGTVHISELQYPTYYYNKKNINRITCKLEGIICDKIYDEIIIESTIVDTSTWGEVIANCINAKHLVFSLQEDNTIINESIKLYLQFKYSRNEVACISADAAKMMMHSVGVSSKDPNEMFLLAYNGSPVEDYYYPLSAEIEAKNYDYIIGSVGRLDKIYVLPMVEDIVEYINRDNNHSYVLLLLGGGEKDGGVQEKIEQMCAGVSNLTLYVTGYIYPIPRALIQLCDIAISSSGSAGVCKMEGIITVSMDGRDGKPIGVVGYTTSHHLYRVDEPILPLSSYLDDILKLKKYPAITPMSKGNPTYTKHFEYLDKSSQTKEFYDVHNLEWNRSQWVHRLVMPIFGPQKYHKLINYIKCKRNNL